MSYRIDQATCNDVEDLCAVQTAAIERFSASEYSEEEINAWAGHINIPHALNTIQDEETEIYVARDEYDMVLGFSAIKGDQITDIYVDPAHAHEGIGTALLRKAEWHIRKNGARMARLLSTLNSVGFYIGQGYNKLRKRNMPVNDEVELEMVEMRKRLGSR